MTENLTTWWFLAIRLICIVIAAGYLIDKIPLVVIINDFGGLVTERGADLAGVLLAVAVTLNCWFLTLTWFASLPRSVMIGKLVDRSLGLWND